MGSEKGVSLLRRHYRDISNGALQNVAELQFPYSEFETNYGVNFFDMLTQNRVLNCTDAMKTFSVDCFQLEKLWRAGLIGKKSIWLNHSIENDPFGRAMLLCGVDLEMIEKWALNPCVRVLAADDETSKTMNIFEIFEDLNYSDCLITASAYSSDDAALFGRKTS